MVVSRTLTPRVVLTFAWRTLLISCLLSSIIYVLHDYLHLKISIPFLPVTAIGTAVAFYLNMKNTASYNRLWEGRTVWGAITNASRAWAAQIGALGLEPELRTQMVYRHLAWMHFLRLQLRKTLVFHNNSYTHAAQITLVQRVYGPMDFEAERKAVIDQFLNSDDLMALSSPNPAATLLSQQQEQLSKLKRAGILDAIEYSDLTGLITELYRQQGASERIKSFPYPRQYAVFSQWFVYIFIFLLPFGMIGELAKMGDSHTWLVIPFCMLISWVFHVMEQVGDASENPFEYALNDVPLSTICRNIERELRSALGETELPPAIVPINDIVM